jgi:WD40 repeat protein
VLLARQGVALDDTVQTRGNLFAALLKAPAAIGVLRGEGERMTAVELSPDGNTLAAGDPMGNVFLFETRTRQRVGIIKPGTANSWIVALAYSPDGSRLAIGHDTVRGNIVTVFDSESRRPVATLRTPLDRWVNVLRFSPDGSTLDVIAGAKDPEAEPALLARFDARTGRPVGRPMRINRTHESPLLATSDGARLVTAGKGEVVLRDAATLRALRRFAVGGAASFNSNAFALSPDDRTLAIGDETGALRFLDLDSGRVRVGSDRHSGDVTAVAFTPDGRTLISAGDDGHAIVWDVTQGTPRETLTGHASGVSSLQITRDGQTLYTASLDGTVFIWDLGGARRLGRPFKAGAGDGFWTSVSSDGRLIAMGQNDGAVSIVDARTLKPRATFPAVPKGPVSAVGFVPGSHVLVAGSGDEDGYLALVDADSGRVIRRLVGHRDALNVPGISADGRLLSTSSAEGTVRFWSLPDGGGLGGLRFTREIFNSQLSPDGRWLTVVLHEDLQNSTVEVWDVRARRRVHRLRFADPPITRFSPDSRLVAIADRVGTQVWSTQTWKPVTRAFAGDPSGIMTAVISRDERTLATANETGAVRLWDIRTQQSIGAPLPGEPSRMAATQFTPDGSGLIASFDNGRAYLWDMRPERLMRQSCEVAGRRLTRDEWAEFLPGRAYDPAC